MTIRDVAAPRRGARAGAGGDRDRVLPRPEAGAQRRARVLARLREVGVLSVTDLARELGVSHMTVRRDLQRLETAGQVRTVHGGVGLVARPRCRRAGRRIARARGGWPAARPAGGPGDTVALDAGPSAYELARALPDGFTGSVITHSMPVMQLLAERVAPRGPGSSRWAAS